jgi:hypothetical protein
LSVLVILASRAATRDHWLGVIIQNGSTHNAFLRTALLDKTGFDKLLDTPKLPQTRGLSFFFFFKKEKTLRLVYDFSDYDIDRWPTVLNWHAPKATLGYCRYVCLIY